MNKDWEVATNLPTEGLEMIEKDKTFVKESKVKDGGKIDYYNIPDWVIDVDDLAEWLDLGFDGGNCLKAIFGLAIARKTGEARHNGTSISRDAKKLKHYANRIDKRINK